MSKYASITIKKAMENIASNNYLIPAIQRKYVWSSEQVELLFDSIMRGYPINAFMLWKITDHSIKQNYKFYTFIKDYCQHFHEDNPDAPSKLLDKDFYAVIDGQQRMTSLYIGLIGTYRYKKPNKWWIDSEENLPTRELYLNLVEPNTSGLDNEMQYSFSFLSKSDLTMYDNTPGYQWFRVGDILKFTTFPEVYKYLINNNIDDDYAAATLTTLWQKIHTEESISFYTIDEQDQNKVLDVFIRANSGGTQLSFSDLLMSISSANWVNHDAKKEIQSARDAIFTFGKPAFMVTQDFILKTILVMCSEDIRFRLENFSRERVQFFESEWESIKKATINTFNLLDSLGYNESLLRAKNAVIPIAYYLYKFDKSDCILKAQNMIDDKKAMLKWLNLSIIKGIFGGQSDTVLKKIKSVIDSDSSGHFPYDAIVKAFADDPNKNYSMDDAFIESLLTEQWGTSTGTIVLNLIYPDEVYQYGKAIAQDHMHPKSFFENEKNLKALNLNDEDMEFYKDKNNYNSILNLQLLNSSLNSSKGDNPLHDWADSNRIKNIDLLLEPSTSLDVKDFRQFIEARRTVLKEKLKNILL